MKSLAAQPANVLDLISYQEGAIVSREIIKEKTGTVTLFAFDEGEGLSEHTSPFGALVHVLEGEVQITISGTASRLKEGDAIIMPANQPHALNAPKKVKLILTMIRS
jgi:quercetin dioxygenase-like cupin family protein